MRRLSLLIPFLFVGCHPTYLRMTAGGGGDLDLLSGVGSGTIPRSMYHAEAVTGYTVDVNDLISVDFGVGGTILAPLDNDPGSAGVGPALEVTPGIRISESLKLIFSTTASWAYFTQKWDPQSTHDGFILSAGPGIEWEIDDEWSLQFGYRLIHESNGSKVFGRPEVNPGFQADALYLGLKFRLGDD